MEICGVRILYAVTYITGKYKNGQPKGVIIITLYN